MLQKVGCVSIRGPIAAIVLIVGLVSFQEKMSRGDELDDREGDGQRIRRTLRRSDRAGCGSIVRVMLVSF